MNIESNIMTKSIYRCLIFVYYEFVHSKSIMLSNENNLNEEIKSSRISIKVSFILTMKVFKINRC